MKTIYILMILLFLTSVTHCQEKVNDKLSFKSYNNFQIELFGHGLFYSINYERIILNRQKLKTTAQLGFAYYPPNTGVIDIWMPVLINELMSFNKHHIEIGIGYIFLNEASRTVENEVESRSWDGFFTGRIGYRFQKPEGHLIIRMGFTPILEYTDFKEFHPSGGLAIGYSF